jgi:hypothetical protein
MIRTLLAAAALAGGALVTPAAASCSGWKRPGDPPCSWTPQPVTIASECAAPSAAALGPGFKIVCGSPVLRQLSDNNLKLVARLGEILTGPEYRALDTGIDTSPAGLEKACGAVASPAVEGCYATRLSAKGDRLRQRLAAETRFTDDP